jgi:ligand-binding SRPBCC domain-containing protein
MAHRFILCDRILVHAPIERCFRLSTHLAIVESELGMRPVPGHSPTRASRLVTGGDIIRWQGWKFGLPQFHESLIESFQPPVFFRDRMIAGRFRTFKHDHSFTDLGNGAVKLIDELRFTMPLGWLGDFAAASILVPHIRGLLHRRFGLLKRIAESSEWKRYLPHDPEQPDRKES